MRQGGTGREPRWRRRGVLATVSLLILLLAGGYTAGRAQRPPDGMAYPPDQERISLGAAFVGGNPRGLAGLLHAHLIVQPPSPDSALGGVEARTYLTALAAATRLDESRFWPERVTPEGQFALEQGSWVVRAGDRVLRSVYHLRWRRAGAGWQIVLLRWTRFR